MSEGTDGGGFGCDGDGAGGEGTGYDGAAGELNSGDGLFRLVADAPRGFLPASIDPGLTYPKETLGHALAYGHGGVKKLCPKGTILTANMADVIALQAARQIGEVDELAPYKTGFLWQHPVFDGIARPAETEDHGRCFNLPGIARNNTTVEVLAWPHAECKPMEETRRIMANAGLTRLDLRQSSQLADIEKRDRTAVLSNQPFGDPKNISNRPNGWFRGVEGETHLWREFYQVKECARVGWWGSTPTDRDCYGTFLCVFGVTYKYGRCEDYETRVAFAVWSVPYSRQGQWTYKWEQIKAHREVAENAAKSMSWFFKRFPGLTASVNQRKRIRLEEMEPPVPPVVIIPRIPPIEEGPPPALGGGKGADRTPGPEFDEAVPADSGTPKGTGPEDEE